jgi:hypothetical protein
MQAWWQFEKKIEMGQVRPFKVIDFFGCHLTHATPVPLPKSQSPQNGPPIVRGFFSLLVLIPLPSPHHRHRHFLFILCSPSLCIPRYCSTLLHTYIHTYIHTSSWNRLNIERQKMKQKKKMKRLCRDGHVLYQVWHHSIICVRPDQPSAEQLCISIPIKLLSVCGLNFMFNARLDTGLSCGCRFSVAVWTLIQCMLQHSVVYWRSSRAMDRPCCTTPCPASGSLSCRL